MQAVIDAMTQTWRQHVHLRLAFLKKNQPLLVLHVCLKYNRCRLCPDFLWRMQSLGFFYAQTVVRVAIISLLQLVLLTTNPVSFISCLNESMQQDCHNFWVVDPLSCIAWSWIWMLCHKLFCLFQYAHNAARSIPSSLDVLQFIEGHWSILA